jgi:hypothetical protein
VAGAREIAQILEHLDAARADPWGKHPGEERRGEWLQHPEEAVVLAALDRFGPEMGRSLLRHGSPAHQSLVGGVLERARDAARQEGVLWTPLLDRIDALNLLPSTEQHQQLESLCRPLAAWASQQTAPALVAPLLAGVRGGQMLTQLLMMVPGVPDEALESVLAAEGAPLEEWAMAKCLTPDQGARLLERALALGEEHAERSARHEPRRGKPAGMMAHYEAPSPADQAEEAARIALMRYRATPDIAARAVAVVARHGASPRMVRTLLGFGIPLRTEQLEQAWDAFAKEWPVALAHSRALTVEQARRLSASVRRSDVLEELATRPEMLADPEILGRMLSTGGIRLARELVKRLKEPDALRAAFRRLLSIKPEEAMHQILDGTLPPDVVAGLRQEDILPGLRHESQAVRLLAIRATARLREVQGGEMRRSQGSLYAGEQERSEAVECSPWAGEQERREMVEGSPQEVEQECSEAVERSRREAEPERPARRRTRA